jgi:chlorobactene glucosyltransferase
MIYLQWLFMPLYHVTALLVLFLFSYRLWSNFKFWRNGNGLELNIQRHYPRTSILVPARNEEKSIVTCVTSLLQQDYPDFEVIILDDASTDKTGVLLDALAIQYPQLRVIHSDKEPPPGWSGKVYACAQLAPYATGDWLLFTDADTQHASQSIMQGFLEAQRLNVSLLSALPYQQTDTWGERLLVPFIMHFLPLIGLNFVSMWHGKGNILANGQYILVNADHYRAIGGHKTIKNALVDDFALAQLFQRNGYHIGLINGTNLLQCRMYYNFKEVWNGFTKNIMLGINSSLDIQRSLLSTLLFAWGYTSVFVIPFYGIFFAELKWLSILEIIWLGFLRLYTDLPFKRPMVEIITTPLAAWGVMILGLNALLRQKLGWDVQWKGRMYSNHSM